MTMLNGQQKRRLVRILHKPSHVLESPHFSLLLFFFVLAFYRVLLSTILFDRHSMQIVRADSRATHNYFQKVLENA